VNKRFTIATKFSCLQQVAEKLKSDGTLAKVQAELRAAVFLAMDGGSSTSSLNPRMEEFAKTSEGKTDGFVGGLGLVDCVVAAVVAAVLAIAVFDASTIVGSYK
jgi:nitrate/nitrite transporter NarK